MPKKMDRESVVFCLSSGFGWAVVGLGAGLAVVGFGVDRIGRRWIGRRLDWPSLDWPFLDWPWWLGLLGSGPWVSFLGLVVGFCLDWSLGRLGLAVLDIPPCWLAIVGLAVRLDWSLGLLGLAVLECDNVTLQESERYSIGSLLHMYRTLSW